ncbi:hypothetical protein SAY87_018898 [Trapa incisa]|uniref:Cytochrome c-553 n=1 Tax=Trapa incisa TaxID=236973 RepID=A0AAN7K3P8_9MYRT|nr:hypothetical protein SAY87_018898 [Trapa incisa]
MQSLSLCLTSLSSGAMAPFAVKGTAVGTVVVGSPKRKEGVEFIRALAPPLMAAIVALSPLCGTPAAFGQTVDIQRGSALFGRACIGCHDAGGNIIQPGATLFTKDLQSSNNYANIERQLQFFFLSPIKEVDELATLTTKSRNGIDTVEEIYKVTYFGKGRMPGFGENCTPKGQCTFGPRLQEEDIMVLAQFVKEQADRGWPVMEVTRQD